MIIADTGQFELGPYTIYQRVRPDNPAWPAYLVFRGDKLIGRNFSKPDLGCCEWLERRETLEPYAEAMYPVRHRGLEKARAVSRSVRAMRRRLRISGSKGLQEQRLLATASEP